ncbi:MAG: hypothetical protein H7A34_06585 [bacterium]|nr:hypothetical protein [bacterium]
MKNLIKFITVCICLIVAANGYAASLNITGPDVTASSAAYIYYGGSGWTYGTNQDFFPGHWNNPGTMRAFAEFNLQSWYDLGLPSSAISSITFSAKYTGAENASDVSLYYMTNDEDGTVNTGDYNAGVTYITTFSLAQYNPYLTSDVTPYILPDIDATQQWSGLSLRLAVESGYSVVYFGGESYPNDQQPILTIEYNEPVTVPEPLTLILTAISVLGLASRKMKKN